MVRNHRHNFQGLTAMDQRYFSTYTRFCWSQPACTRDLGLTNLRVWTFSSSYSLIINALLLTFCTMNSLLLWPSVLLFVISKVCHQGQHLSHNANNLPLWTWWQQYQIILPLWHQGQRVNQDVLFLCRIIPLAILPLSTCWSLCTAEVCCSCSSWL